jgi:hypothetical protein
LIGQLCQSCCPQPCSAKHTKNRLTPTPKQESKRVNRGKN